MKKKVLKKQKQPYWNHVGGVSVMIAAFGKVVCGDNYFANTTDKVHIATREDGFYYFH